MRHKACPSKNLEIVWDIENFCNIAKFRKMKSQCFSMSQTFSMFFSKKHRKMLGLCRFCLHFSEFGYVTKIFYVPNFFYASKKIRKSLGHRKMSVLVFLHKISKIKQGKSDRVPRFSEKT